MRRHQIAFVNGRTGSGKTHLIAHYLGPQHPRRITFDQTGEGATLYPNALLAFGVEHALKAIEVWQRAKIRRWHMVLACSPAEAARFVDVLCPIYDGRRVSLARALGGVAVECFELDVFAPNAGGQGSPWRTAFARGRHVGLTLLCATQRPSLVDRLTTSSAGTIITFATHEPLEVAWMRGQAGTLFARLATELPKYESAWYHKDDATIEHRNSAFRVVRSWQGSEALAGRGA